MYPIGRTSRRRRNRRGITLPLVALMLVGVCGFVALAVDVGRIAVARSQAQAAADVAAMAGARSLNGVQPQDVSTATGNAVSAAAGITVLGQTVTAANVAVTHGTYRYDPVAQTFTPQTTLNAGELYNLTKVDLTLQCPTTFARSFGVNTFNITTTATAAHRPRDVIVLLDYSGSMNVESDLWNAFYAYDNGMADPYNPNNTSNNAETVYPKFGHYSSEKNYSNYANYANLLSPAADAGNPLSGNAEIGKCNISVPALGVPAMVNDFWSNARGQGAASAFAAVPDSALDAYDQAGGDKYLRKNNSAGQPYAATVADLSNGNSGKNTSFEANGYKQLSGTNFLGYTQGPRYWGKTFFIWPPDPKNDWRSIYFGTNDNTRLWNGYGAWNDPPGNYTINYKAILAWIRSNPNAFPPTLRSGNILYYGSIPDDVPPTAYVHTASNSTITNQDQRFWKEYIDFVIGVWRDPWGNISHPGSVNYGPDYTYGTVNVSPPPTDGRYMNYVDNPKRPRHRLWFGPMTMVQYMISAGILPGTAHDISTYPMKVGIGGALLDIQNNHPNDRVAMVLFNRPQHTNDPAGLGSFNTADTSLSTDYQRLLNDLWLPPNSGTADVRPWDANGDQTPCAAPHFGSNTASHYGFMLAYNQFSSSPVLRALEAGGTNGGGGRGGGRRAAHDHLRDRRYGQRHQHAGRRLHQRRRRQLVLPDPAGPAPQRLRRLRLQRPVPGRAERLQQRRRHPGHPLGLHPLLPEPGLPGLRRAGPPCADPLPGLRVDLRDPLVGPDLVGKPARLDRLDRRHAVPQFTVRPDRRLQVVHRHARPALGQAPPGVPHDHEQLDPDHPDQVTAAGPRRARRGPGGLISSRPSRRPCPPSCRPARRPCPPSCRPARRPSGRGT